MHPHTDCAAVKLATASAPAVRAADVRRGKMRGGLGVAMLCDVVDL